MVNFFPNNDGVDYYIGIFDFDDFLCILKEKRIKYKIDSLKSKSPRTVFFCSENKKFQGIEFLDISSYTTLYHYTSSFKAIKILASNSLRFSNRENFNDNFDTRLYKCNFKENVDIDLIKKNLQSIDRRIFHKMRNILNQDYINL